MVWLNHKIKFALATVLVAILLGSSLGAHNLSAYADKSDKGKGNDKQSHNDIIGHKKGVKGEKEDKDKDKDDKKECKPDSEGKGKGKYKHDCDSDKKFKK